MKVTGDWVVPEGYTSVETGLSSWYFSWRVMGSSGVILEIVSLIVWFQKR